MKTFTNMINLKLRNTIKVLAVLGLVLLGLTETTAQDILSLEEAKSIALAQSYRVQLSGNEVSVAQNSTAIAKAGYKPTFGLNAGVNGNLNNSIVTKPIWEMPLAIPAKSLLRSGFT